MMMKKPAQKYIILAISVTTLMLSACSTQGASRYGDVHEGQGAVPCGTVMVPCGQVIEYHPVQVQPPAYLVPAPCQTGQCQPVPKPPVVIEPPVEAPQPPIIEPTPYVPPAVPEPLIVLPPPVVDDPVISCPEGTIPSYGGQDCIPITVPRK